MEPISIGLGIVGLGMQIFGGMKGAEVSREQAQESSAIAGDEQKINAQKRVAMELTSRRQQLEVMRNAQRARAQATAAATNQGANLGSGLAGGLSQIRGDEAYNSQGINQSLSIGENVFDINNDISSHKMRLASLGGEAATDAGLASLGGALIKAGPTIGAFGKQLGGVGDLFSLFGGGSLSGGFGRT